MFGMAAAERKAIESTYEDTLTVIRQQDVTVNSITKTQPQELFAGTICALSQNGGGTGNQTETVNEIQFDAKIFAPPELEVKPGDTIAVKRFGRLDPASSILLTFEPAGRPAPYATHQEIKVKVREKA